MWGLNCAEGADFVVKSVGGVVALGVGKFFFSYNWLNR